jgi:hypothetical protein
MHAQLDHLALLGMTAESPVNIVSAGFPTRIDRAIALDYAGINAIQWLLDRDVIVSADEDHYGLTDEFLRVRLMLDQAENEIEAARMDARMITERTPRPKRLRDLFDKRINGERGVE